MDGLRKYNEGSFDSLVVPDERQAVVDFPEHFLEGWKMIQVVMAWIEVKRMRMI